MTDVANFEQTEILTVREAGTLADHEAVIERGLATFVDVGNALLAIRDQRLYRASHDTFEEYCQRRWGFNRHRASQLIGAAGVVTNVTSIGLPAPANEGQARELARVPEAQRADVWRETVERTGGKPTAAAIRETYQPPAEDAPSAIEEPADVDPDAGSGPSAERMPPQDGAWPPQPRETIPPTAPSAERAAVGDYLAQPDPELDRLQLRNRFLSAQQKAADLALFEPDRIALLLTTDAEWNDLKWLRKRIEDWFQRVEAARPAPGLRLVKGA